MLKTDKPYFMKNKEWYYYDVKSFKYKLTDKAPKKAIDSYNEYYNQDLEQYDITIEDIKDAE